MGYRLERDEPLADGIRRIAREEIDGALVAVALAEPDTGVHTVRKGFKKLRALLRLVPFEGARERGRTFRDAGRTIGDLRDAKVLGDAADAMAQAGIAGARQALDLPADADRSAAAADALAALRGALDAFRADVPTWRLGDLSYAHLTPGVDRAFRRGRKRMREAAQTPDTQPLHEWRKRAKDLWYHARLLLPGDDVTAHPFADELDRLSDVLGTEHDLAVLSERLAPYDGLREAQVWIAGRRDALQREAFDIGARVYAREDHLGWFVAQSHIDR